MSRPITFSSLMLTYSCNSSSSINSSSIILYMLILCFILLTFSVGLNTQSFQKHNSRLHAHTSLSNAKHMFHYTPACEGVFFFLFSVPPFCSLSHFFSLPPLLILFTHVSHDHTRTLLNSHLHGHTHVEHFTSIFSIVEPY